MEKQQLPLGTLLQTGKYVVEGIIGQGGFGITYRARQVSLNRICAIKEFFPAGYCVRDYSLKVQPYTQSSAAFEKYADRFLNEAQSLSQLNHPNIVKVLDVFPENGTIYLVMEYIEGRDLRQIVQKSGPLDVFVAVNYIAQIADALEYVHERGMLHRDVKPENILITPNNTAILIDFDSARRFEQDMEQRHTTILTKGYAPLEQYSVNAKRGAYTDIYSLGGVFYFLLTGNKPLDAMERFQTEMPRPKVLRPDIPSEIDAAIWHALALRAEHRPQVVADFRKELLGESSTSPGSPLSGEESPIEQPDHKKRLLIILSIVAGVICLGLTILILCLALDSKNGSPDSKGSGGGFDGKGTPVVTGNANQNLDDLPVLVEGTANNAVATGSGDYELCYQHLDLKSVKVTWKKKRFKTFAEAKAEYDKLGKSQACFLGAAKITGPDKKETKLDAVFCDYYLDAKGEPKKWTASEDGAANKAKLAVKVEEKNGNLVARKVVVDGKKVEEGKVNNDAGDKATSGTDNFCPVLELQLRKPQGDVDFSAGNPLVIPATATKFKVKLPKEIDTREEIKSVKIGVEGGQSSALKAYEIQSGYIVVTPPEELKGKKINLRIKPNQY